MSTLKIKTVDEVAIELNSKRLPASGAIHPREIRDAFVADRAAIHTSLVVLVAVAFPGWIIIRAMFNF